MNDKKQIVILDAGHGGFDGGRYLTAPENGKWFKHQDGSVFYEGEFNRQIKYRVMELLYLKDIAYHDLTPEQTDVPLSIRCNRANRFHEENEKKTFLVSLHSDASDKTAMGIGIWLNETCSEESKKIAGVAANVFKAHFPNDKQRGIKYKNLAILRDTKMPAILIENFFFDNWSDYNTHLRTQEGRNRIANCISDFINIYVNKTT